jgi:hypothetical protein
MNLYFCRLVAEAHGGTLELAPSLAGVSLELRFPHRVTSAQGVRL